MANITGNKSPCDEFREYVSEFREGLLDESTYLKLESHRSECKNCSGVLAEEEKFASMMSEIPEMLPSPDFRDRVLRAWRVKRSSVEEKVRTDLLRKIQYGLYALTAFLLVLPLVRNSLMASGNFLRDSYDRLPEEYREGIQISLTLPTWQEIIARFQVLQGSIFEGLGNTGSAIAPYSGWLWFGLVTGILILFLSSSLIRKSLSTADAKR
ncbi:MAG TPA: hypothetical protein VGB30_01350 [bacterium]|jgi:hypothetical protein